MYSGNLAQSCCSVRLINFKKEKKNDLIFFLFEFKANVTQDSTWLGNVLSVTIPKISSTSACTSTTKPVIMK